MEARHGQPAVRPPGPVSDNGVNKASHPNTVEDVSPEAAATNHSTRGDSRGRIGKGELEDPEGQKRYTSCKVGRRKAEQEEAMSTNYRRARLKHKGKAPGPE